MVNLHRTALWLPPDPRDGGADRRVLVLSKRSLSSSPESSRTVTTATLLSASFEGAADALTLSALAPAAADAALPRADAVFPDAAAAADLDSPPLAPPADQNFTSRARLTRTALPGEGRSCRGGGTSESASGTGGVALTWRRQGFAGLGRSAEAGKTRSGRWLTTTAVMGVV